MNPHSKSIFITVEQKHVHILELLPLQLILNLKIIYQPRRVSWHSLLLQPLNSMLMVIL